MAAESHAAEAEQLDQEIASLKEQGQCSTHRILHRSTYLSTDNVPATVAAVQKQLQIETSTIISSEPGQKLIKSSTSSAARSRPWRSPASQTKLLSQAERQEAHIQQCYYRICAPVTTFKVRDPDPNAVDGGHVLGLRFEVMLRGQFLKPYYVMLNRPYANSTHLRIHRHTLPPAVPLAGLSARHLPPPRPDADSSTPKQDLDRFARTLRREIVRYHNRMGASADLRRDLGLHLAKEDDDLGPSDIIDVGIADIEAKQITLTWADERSGRLLMDDDGRVVKLVVCGDQGRDWETTRDWESTKQLGGNNDRIKDVVKQLQEYGAD